MTCGPVRGRSRRYLACFCCPTPVKRRRRAPEFLQAMVRGAQQSRARAMCTDGWCPLSATVTTWRSMRRTILRECRRDRARRGARGWPLFQRCAPPARGRTFSAQDGRPVDEAIVSHAFEVRYGPARVRLASAFARWVALTPSSASGRVRYDGLEKPPSETLYFPTSPPGRRKPTPRCRGALFVVRTMLGEGETLSAIAPIVVRWIPPYPTYRLMAR